MVFGLYLPIHLSVTMMIGGIIRDVIDRKRFKDEIRAKKIEKGTILASGYIAGDALMGVIATALIYCGSGIDCWSVFDPIRTENAWVTALLYCVVIGYFCYSVFSSQGEESLTGRDISL